MKSDFIEMQIPTYIERTKEHLIMGHSKKEDKDNTPNESCT